MGAVDHHVIAEHTVHAWCMDMSATVQQQKLDAHLNLISPRIHVYGVPKVGVIDFKEWETRRRNELTNKELLVLNYQKIRLITSTQRRLTFNTTETMISKDGHMVILDKNIVLEKEEDGCWRAIEENINSWQVRKLNLAKY